MSYCLFNAITSIAPYSKQSTGMQEAKEATIKKRKINKQIKEVASSSNHTCDCH